MSGNSDCTAWRTDAHSSEPKQFSASIWRTMRGFSSLPSLWRASRMMCAWAMASAPPGAPTPSWRWDNMVRWMWSR
eukprot:5480919-Heterocapsa_arctica.AAC.1